MWLCEIESKNLIRNRATHSEIIFRPPPGPGRTKIVGGAPPPRPPRVRKKVEACRLPSERNLGRRVMAETLAESSVKIWVSTKTAASIIFRGITELPADHFYLGIPPEGQNFAQRATNTLRLFSGPRGVWGAEPPQLSSYGRDQGGVLVGRSPPQLSSYGRSARPKIKKKF